MTCFIFKLRPRFSADFSTNSLSLCTLLVPFSGTPMDCSSNFMPGASSTAVFSARYFEEKVLVLSSFYEAALQTLLLSISLVEHLQLNIDP